VLKATGLNDAIKIGGLETAIRMLSSRPHALEDVKDVPNNAASKSRLVIIIMIRDNSLVFNLFSIHGLC